MKEYLTKIQMQWNEIKWNDKTIVLFSLWKLYSYFCHSTNYKSNDSKGRQKCSLWKFVIHGKLKFFKKMGQMIVKPQIVVTIEVLMHIMSFINSLVRYIMMRKLFVTKKNPRQNDCTVEAKANVIQQLLCTSGAIHKLCRLKIGDFWHPPPS